MRLKIQADMSEIHNHNHQHTHGAGHSHSHLPADYSKAFAVGIALNLIYIAVEFIYGLSINSMALIADAGHNLSDVLGLGLAWGAAYLAKSSITNRRTYGLRKSTILASLFNAILLLIAVGAIIIEAVRKILDPEPVAGDIVMIVAAIGVVINTITALFFIRGKDSDINIKGAYLHMAADAVVSLGVVGAGFLIHTTGFYLIDPLMSLIIAVVITAGTWGLLKDSFQLSMDAVPPNINLDRIKEYLVSLPGVKDVHDLHVWAMSTTETALTVHLVIPDEVKDDQFLNKICHSLYADFHINHSTVQIEKNAQSSNCDSNNV